MRMNTTPQQLERYALTDNWEPIDKTFSSMSDVEFRNLIPFAREKLTAEQGNLQDLGATIFQNYSGVIAEQDKSLLRRVARKPGNEFARYRAGFALWKHGEKTPYVRKILSEALKCKDVADIARELLQQAR